MKKKLLLSFMFSVLIGLSANAQWQPIGPGGGIVKCFAKGGSKIYAATFGGGVFKTTDNGAVWTNINNGLTNTDVQALAVTITGDTVLAGTYNGGVFLSINGGANWASISSNLTGLGLLVQAVAIKGNKIFAGTSAGVFVLSNYSGNWTAVNTGLGSTLDVLCLLVNGGDIFVGTGAGGVFLSINEGVSWNVKNTGLPTSPNKTVNALAVNGTKLYAGVDGGIYSSVNNGGNWSLSHNTSALVKSIDVNGTTIYAGYGTMTSGGIAKSTDDGGNWTTVNTGLPSGKGIYAVLQSGSVVFAGTDGKGLYTTANNGGLWVSDPGITNTNAQSLSLAISGPNVFAGIYGGGVYKSTLNSGPWTAANSGLPATNLINTLITSGTTIFVGTEQNGVYRSTDDGVSWTAMNSGLGTNLNISSFAVGGGYIYAGTQFGTGGGVYRSTVGGSSWTLVNTGLTNTDVISLAVSGTNVFAGTFYGGVFYSNNNGGSWTEVNNGLTNLYINTLAISGTRVFAGTNAGVYTTNDNGGNWYDRNIGLTDMNAIKLFITGYNIFLGTDGGGVFISNDSANAWSAINTNLGNYRVWALAESGTDIFAGTKGGSVWKRPMADFDFAITTQSADASVCGTSDAYFSVAATGVNITYLWQVSTDNGSSFNDCFDGIDYSGVYTNTLTVLGAEIYYKNNFKYRCVITSGVPVNSTVATLTINETPMLSVTDPTAVCSPNTVDITGTYTDLSTSVGTVTYWTDSIATISLTTPTSVSTSGTYYIKKAAGTCTDIEPVVVTINALPDLNVSNPSAVCSPGTIDITGTFTDLNSTTGTISYWADAGATISIPAPSAIDTSGTFYIRKIATGGCTDIQPVSLTIDTTPDLDITNPPAVCFPNTVDITIVFTDLNGTTGTVTYWEDSLATIPLTAPTAVAVSGTYYIQKSANGACLDMESVKVIIRPLPVVSYTQSPLIVCDNDSPLTLAGGSPAGGTYSGTGVTANVFDPSVAGSGNWTIVYTYSDAYTCTDVASQSILVDLCTGTQVEAVSKESTVTVFPNPFSASITLTGIENSADIVMYNMLGAQIGYWKIINPTTTLKMDNIPAGVYFLHLKTEKGFLIKKIIKE